MNLVIQIKTQWILTEKKVISFSTSVINLFKVEGNVLQDSSTMPVIKSS